MEAHVEWAHLQTQRLTWSICAAQQSKALLGQKSVNESQMLHFPAKSRDVSMYGNELCELHYEIVLSPTSFLMDPASSESVSRLDWLEGDLWDQLKSFRDTAKSHVPLTGRWSRPQRSSS